MDTAVGFVVNGRSARQGAQCAYRPY
ncbi:hypothetical protein PI125_g23700, partial [Phytophthora idaei]